MTRHGEGFKADGRIDGLRATVSIPLADLEALVERLVDQALTRREDPHSAPDDGDRLLDAREAAALLGYTPRYVLRLGREGEIARHKMEGRRFVRFRKADVLAYAANRQPPPTNPRAVQVIAPAPSRKPKWERRKP